MISVLSSDLKETIEACKAKGIPINIKNSKYILSKFFLSLIFRINQIEDSLTAKGYES